MDKYVVADLDHSSSIKSTVNTHRGRVSIHRDSLWILLLAKTERNDIPSSLSTLYPIFKSYTQNCSLNGVARVPYDRNVLIGSCLSTIPVYAFMLIIEHLKHGFLAKSLDYAAIEEDLTEPSQRL